MPVSHDRDSDLQRARAHLAKIVSNSTDPESLTSYKQLRKLRKQHEFTLGEMLTNSDGKPMSFEDLMKLGNKAKEVIATGKAAFTDPDVRATAMAAAELFRGVGAVVKKVRGR